MNECGGKGRTFTTKADPEKNDWETITVDKAIIMWNTRPKKTREEN